MSQPGQNTTTHLTEWVANRHLAGELSEAEEATLGDHLDRCGACRDYLASIKAFDADLSAHRLPDWKARAPRPEDLVGVVAFPERPARWKGWRTLSVAAAIAATVLLALALWGDRDPTQVDLPGGPTDTLRVKSGGLGFEVYLKGQGGAKLITSGDEVHPGDQIGFRVYPQGDGHLMIIGRDERGEVYLCHPQSGLSEAVLENESAEGQTVGQAMELDEVLGQERIIALMCPEPFGFEQVKAEAVSAQLAGAQRLPPLRERCSQREVLLIKKDRQE